jgi:O-succinylbenzoate synthase
MADHPLDGRIVAVELRRVRLPLRHPMVAAHGTEHHRDVVLVAAERADGTVGRGECSTLSRPTYTAEWTGAAWWVLRDELVPALLAGGDAGIVGHPMATASLATAVLDARLRSEATNLAAFLGAEAGRAVPSTAVSGIHPTVDALLAAVSADLAAGHRSVKCKIRPGWDVEPLAAVRSAWPDLALAADANGAYGRSDVAHLAELDDLALAYLEQPFAADDLLASAELARRTGIRLALDESITSVAAVALVAELGAAHVVSAKPARLGGVDVAARVVALAAERGLGAFVGGMLETGIGRAAALAVAALPGCDRPTDLGPSSRYFAADLTPALELDGAGALTVPTGPGLGVAPDIDRLDAVTVDRLVLKG